MSNRNKRRLAEMLRKQVDFACKCDTPKLPAPHSRNDGSTKGTYHGFSRPTAVFPSGSGGQMKGRQPISSQNYIVSMGKRD